MKYSNSKIEFSSSGHKLVGSHYVPEQTIHSSGILFLHGAGTSTKERFKLWQPFLAEKGIASFAFDYRGCGESEGKFEDSSLNNRLIDAQNALDTFLQSGIDRNNLTVLGASMSGHIAVRLIEKNPGIKSIILQCAAAYGTDAENKPLNEGFTQIIRQDNNWINSPVFEILERYQGKVYSFYGQHDDVIPLDVQQRYNQIANQKGRAIILPHATHTLLQPQNQLQEEAMYTMYQLSYDFITSKKQ